MLHAMCSEQGCYLAFAAQAGRIRFAKAATKTQNVFPVCSPCETAFLSPATNERPHSAIVYKQFCLSQPLCHPLPSVLSDLLLTLVPIYCASTKTLPVFAHLQAHAGCHNRCPDVMLAHGTRVSWPAPVGAWRQTGGMDQKLTGCGSYHQCRSAATSPRVPQEISAKPSTFHHVRHQEDMACMSFVKRQCSASMRCSAVTPG